MIGSRGATEAWQAMAGTASGGDSMRGSSISEAPSPHRASTRPALGASSMLATLSMLAGLAACSAAPPMPAASDGLVATSASAVLAPALPASRTSSDAASRLGTLQGLRPVDIVRQFGQPDFRRTEPPAELWQYRTADCVLDIFLYAEPDGFHVLHAEVRGRGGAVASRGGCFEEAAPLPAGQRQSHL
jgi:hypothetical protein